MRLPIRTSLAVIALALCTQSLAEVKTETIAMPMRDGVKLATDVYRDDAVKQAPVVLMRTPYDRTKQKALGERWVKAGYIFVAQDCRGTSESEGVVAPYNNEGQDGLKFGATHILRYCLASDPVLLEGH